MWALESHTVTGGSPWGADQVWGLQELHLLFKLMELPVNGVRSVTSSGAIAAVYFVKTKGVPGNCSFTLSLKLATETGLKGKEKKDKTLIYRTWGSVGQLILSVSQGPGVPPLPAPLPLLLQVGRSSRRYCTLAAMSTCVSASITVDNAASRGERDPGHSRVSMIAACSRWLVWSQSSARPTIRIVASAANGHLINTPAPGALMTLGSKCFKDRTNNARE